MSVPVLIYKSPGQTPLEALEGYRKKHPELVGVSITYAGRLDPMAHGLLLLLVGNDVHDKEHYLNLDKEYIVQILVGVHTDTYDVLGMIDEYDATITMPTLQWWEAVLEKYVGVWEQEYPPYASKTVHGVPLFMYARAHTLHTITIPTKTVNIPTCEVLDVSEEVGSFIHQRIDTMIRLVSGDFRQKEIREQWQRTLENAQQKVFQIVSIRVVCSSGTYIRSLVHRISEDTGIPTCVWGLERTQIGMYTLADIK